MPGEKIPVPQPSTPASPMQTTRRIHPPARLCAVSGAQVMCTKGVMGWKISPGHSAPSQAHLQGMDGLLRKRLLKFIKGHLRHAMEPHREL